VEYPKGPKPFLGGFTDKRSCITFHHASTEPELFDDSEWQTSGAYNLIDLRSILF